MDTRRCNSESCQIAAARTARFDVPVATVLIDPQSEWLRMAYGGVRVARNIEVDWNEFSKDKFLFSHCTIVSSVGIETDDSKPGAGYYIDPVCSGLVNNNGNAWSNPVLLATFRTFVGAYNYLEHVQIPELSKGRILDAVIRPVVYKNQDGKTANVDYVDILVATSRKHDGLVRKIASGELNSMSMGCAVAGTSVLMADGTTNPVERVIVGDKVVTHTGGIARVESTRVRPTEPGELRRLSLTGMRDTYVTGEHPYWALVGYDVCVGCGKEMGRSEAKPWNLGQILHPWCSASCRQKHLNSNPKCKKDFHPVAQKVKFGWVPVAELRKGDYVAVPLGRPPAERPRLERVRARLMGYYAAEGNLQRSGRGIVRAVEFSLHADEASGDEIVSLAREWGVPADRIYSQIRKRKSGTSRRIVIHDREMAACLHESCGEHCDHKRFAPWVMGTDDESLLEILGAYVNGDGHCRKDSARFTTASCSKALSEQVVTMMMAVGIPVGTSESNHKGKKPAWYVNTRKGYAGILAGRTFKFRPQQTNSQKVSEVGGYMLRRVTGNKPMEVVCDVYNIHVANEADDHSYIMNGVAVHNCLAHRIQCSRCGVVLTDADPNCAHVESDLLRPFKDENGVTRMTAELCGCCLIGKDGKLARDENGNLVGDPKSLEFIEASWVGRPAFGGAVLNHFLSDIPLAATKVLRMDMPDIEAVANDIFRMRVADAAGMMVLKVARAEIIRRRRIEIAERVAEEWL